MASWTGGVPRKDVPLFRCRVATTGNIANLASGAPNAVDGKTPVVGDIVLVWRQTTGSQNGPYRVDVVGTGANGQWSRIPEFNVSVEALAGSLYLVAEGTAYHDAGFQLETDDPIVLGTTALTFAPKWGPATTVAAWQTLADAATIAWDASLGSGAQVTLGGNRTLGAPTNLVAGGRYDLAVIQDGTGGRTLAWNAAFKFSNGAGSPSKALNAAASALTLYSFVSPDGTNLYEIDSIPALAQTLTDGANIDWNLSLGACAQVTLGGNRTMNAPAGSVSGRTYSCRVIQDGTGGRTLTWASAYKFRGGSQTRALVDVAGESDLFVFWCDGTNLWEISNVGAMTPGIYGDGSDGDVTIVGDTTLSRNMSYSRLTVNAGVTLRTNGFQIHCSGALHNAGTIGDAGNAAVGATPGAGKTGGVSNGTLAVTSGAGGAGSAILGVGAAGSANATPCMPPCVSLDGGAGGTGGGLVGGAGGSGSGVRAANWGRLDDLWTLGIQGTASVTNAGSGAGGGAGGSDPGTGTATSGGGGGGAIQSDIFARVLHNTGVITAAGGAGGDAAATGDGAAGGGGGGAGAYVRLVCDRVVAQGTITAAGGAGGAGAGGGAAGSAGTTGAVILIEARR